MKLLKVVSILALAGLMTAGPALAQTRDTRPDQPDRPQIEDNNKGDGDSERESDVKPYLPRGTAGMGCVVMDKEGLGLWVSVTNETGVDIPAGSTVTYYVQPGNIQKTYILAKPWKAGKTIETVLDSEGVPMPAECSVKLRAGRNQPEIGESMGFKPGDVDAFEPAIKPQPKYEFACKLTNGGIVVTNTGETTILAGSYISVYVPDFYTGFYVDEDVPPGGGVFHKLGSILSDVRHGALCEPDGFRLPLD